MPRDELGMPLDDIRLRLDARVLQHPAISERTAVRAPLVCPVCEAEHEDLRDIMPFSRLELQLEGGAVVDGLLVCLSIM